MKERRIQRLQELIKERVAEVIDRDISDPRRGLVTITRVKLDREVTHCIVYWSILGTDAARRTNERMLTRAAGYVQRELGAVLHTRTVPRVRFVLDESIAGAQRIDEILHEIREECGERGDEADGDDAAAAGQAEDTSTGAEPDPDGPAAADDDAPRAP